MRHAVWMVVERAWHQEPGQIFYVRLEPCEARELTIRYDDLGEEGDEPPPPETHIYRDHVTAYCEIGFNSFPEWWDDERYKGFTFEQDKPLGQIIAELKDSEWQTEYVHDFNSSRLSFRDITEFVFSEDDDDNLENLLKP